MCNFVTSETKEIILLKIYRGFGTLTLDEEIEYLQLI